MANKAVEGVHAVRELAQTLDKADISV